MEKLKENQQKKQKTPRFFVIILVFIVTFFVLNLLINKQENKKQAIKLPTISLEKILPDQILNEAKRVIFGDKIPVATVDGEKQGEPIAEPAEKIQGQTSELIESIKKLPQDQFEAIRKQLFKEFCQDYCQVATNGGKDGQ